MTNISIEKCPCGDCRDYHLRGIGSFVQGSGFSKSEAQRIVKALNLLEEIDLPEEGMITVAKEALTSLLRTAYKEGYEDALSQGSITADCEKDWTCSNAINILDEIGEVVE